MYTSFRNMDFKHRNAATLDNIESKRLFYLVIGFCSTWDQPALTEWRKARKFENQSFSKIADTLMDLEVINDL